SQQSHRDRCLGAESDTRKRAYPLHCDLNYSIEMSSAASTSSSTPTSVPLPLNDGPVYFMGRALVSFQVITTSVRSSFCSWMVTVRSAFCDPVRTAFSHSHRSSAAITPRLSVTSVILCIPVIFMGELSA